MSWQEYGRQAADNYIRRYGDANVRHIRAVDHDNGSDQAEPGLQRRAPVPGGTCLIACMHTAAFARSLALTYDCLPAATELRAPHRTASQFTHLTESTATAATAETNAASFAEAEKHRQSRIACMQAGACRH